jgi:UDP-galactopyranose mutase
LTFPLIVWGRKWRTARLTTPETSALKQPLLIGLAGAGLSGAVLARTLAEHGHRCVLFEARSHVAGNCHTARDASTGILVHAHGPHIFHTDDDEVWAWVQRFMAFEPFVHRVRAQVGDRQFALPIHLNTLNAFFGTQWSEPEARRFVAEQADATIAAPQNFEEQALKFMGRALYEAFFRGYTRKQWGVEPRKLPAAILKRLPLRFDHNDNYFSHRHQGMPVLGYTALVERVLDHPKIELHLEHALQPGDVNQFDHVFWSGPLDAYFGRDLGALPYRTLDFERFEDAGDFQGCAVVNHCDEAVPWTRISEHKHFAPWERHERTVCFREYSRACGEGDTPYYPVHLADRNPLLETYQARAAQTRGVSFVGRLGSFRYLDMDATIRAALDTARAFLHGA